MRPAAKARPATATSSTPQIAPTRPPAPVSIDAARLADHGRAVHEALGIEIDDPQLLPASIFEVEEPASVRISREIMTFINSQGYQFKEDTLTEADGNCFITSLLLQLQRPNLKSDYHQQLVTSGHEEFRQSVKRFVLSSSDSKVKALKERFDELEGNVPPENGSTAVGIGLSWDEYWKKIVVPNTWVDHTFIQSSAWFLGKDIMIITTNSDNPSR